MDGASQDEVVVAELAALLRARHPSGLEQLELPRLRRAAARRAMTVTKMVLDGIEHIDDPRTRHAARELVPIPFGSRIAATLTDRRISAARSFGQSGNYFRSGPSDRSKPSSESLVLAALGAALVVEVEADDGDRDVEDPSAPIDQADQVDDVAERTGWVGERRSAVALKRDRGGALLALLAAGMALIGAVAWMVTTQASEPNTAETQTASGGERSGGCRHKLGSGTVFLRNGFRTALREAGAVEHCPLDEVQTYEGMAFQRLAGNEADSSWVAFRRPDGRFLVLPATAWERYRSVADAGIGLDGLGVPTAWSELADRAELLLDGGLTIASEAPHGLYFLVHPDFDRLWHERIEELGAPYSSGMMTQIQHFAGGYVELDGKQARVVEVSATAAMRALPPRSIRSEAVIIQPSGIAWWIDREDRRWSIRSAQVPECLGGQGAVVDDSVPGHAIAQLELGGVADCSLSPD